MRMMQPAAANGSKRVPIQRPGRMPVRNAEKYIHIHRILMGDVRLRGGTGCSIRKNLSFDLHETFLPVKFTNAPCRRLTPRIRPGLGARCPGVDVGTPERDEEVGKEESGEAAESESAF